MSSEARRFLIVGPAWVGDMVMAQSLFMTLKRQHPDCSIDVIAPDWSLPILARMPEVRRGIALPIRHKQFGLLTRYRIGRSLRDERYTHAIILPRSLKSALLPFFARVPQRTGYRGEMRFGLINDMRVLDKSTLTQTVQRQVALGLARNATLPPPIPQPTLTIDTQNQSQLVQSLGLSLTRPVIGFMPGAEYGPAKQWPLEYYTELAGRIAAAGKQVWVFGSAKEQPLGEQIRLAAPDAVTNLCGKTRLQDAVDLIAACTRVVSNDSGLMHVACATGVPVVAIYGSSTPDYTPPLSSQASILYQALDCSPCFKRTCPLGHTRCLRDITPTEVYKRL